MSIIKSPNDPRLYQMITLSNKMEILLISDQDADKSAACLNISIGSIDDPKDSFGLAHFHEHMLFLGTEKYPNQNDFSSYLSKNGSEETNASTGLTSTDFYFDCGNEGFFGALDRFAQFFISPLFTEAKTDSEIQAIHSEFEMILNEDRCREEHLFHILAEKENPYNHFGCGNKETLSRETNLREKLLNFNKSFYSSNKMKLSVYSNYSLEEMSETVKNLFSPVKNLDLPPRKSFPQPYQKANMCKFLEIVPIKSKEFLDIIWIIPRSFTLEYETKPESLIGHLFGHEGKNSLLSCLKQLGLATALTHYTVDEAQVFTIFSCQIELTNSDPINIDLVCEIVFGFLKILKESRDCKRLYDECAEIKRIHFEYKEKKKPIDYVTLMSDNMHKYKKEHVIVGDYLMNEYNEKSFLDLLEQFQFENMIISLKSKKFEGKTEFIEPIYNIKYNNRNLDEKIRFLFENPRDIYKKMMGLPFENQFLARNFQLITDENDKFPVKIFSKDNSSAYLKRGSVFQIPKLTIYLKIFINSDLFQGNVEKYICAELWIDLFKNYMNETIYMAELVGISSHIELDSNGLLIIIKGFSDSVTKYIYCLINEIKEFIKLNDKKNTFEIYLEKRTKDYLNFFKTKPYKLSNYIKSVILMKNGIRYSIESLYSNIKNITFEKFVEFEKNWLQNLSFLWFINGNLSSIQAETMITKTEAELRSININSNQNKIEINILKLIENQPILYEHYISKIITDYEDNNSSLQLYYEGEKNDPLSVLKSKIIGRYLADPFFDELRTDKQLGYVVQSFEENFRGILGFNFLIMSSMYNSYYVSEKVREFLFAMNDKLKIMNEDDFEELKESVLDEVLCKDNNIFEESGKMWEEIRTNQFLFNRREIYEKLMDEIELQEVLDLYNKIFLECPKVLEIHLINNSRIEECKQGLEIRKNKEKSIYLISNLNECKEKSEFHPDYYN